jgi:hypothetical protein
MGVTFHALESVGECEGMNLHTPKVNSHFGNWNPNGFLNFQNVIAESKPIGLKIFLYH